MAIVLGLLSAAIYGAADFTGGLAAKRVAALTVVVWSQLAGLVVLAVVLPLTVDAPPLTSDLALGAVAGVAGGSGVALLYRALARGRMTVVAPITAVGAAAVPVIVGLLLGERPGLLPLVGVVVALVAVVLVSSSPEPAGDGHTTADGPLGLRPGVAEAIVAGLAFGVFFIVLDATSDGAGLWPLLGARTSILVCGAAALLSGTSLNLPRAAAPRIAAAGVLDMAANVLYLLAAKEGLLSLVAVLVSLYPASTVLLARFVLKERLARVQLVGLGATLGGVVLIAGG